MSENNAQASQDPAPAPAAAAATQAPNTAEASVPKKAIPHPSEVHPSKHKAVLNHVVEQFVAGHYEVEQGSVHIETLSPGRDKVTFVRTHDPHVAAAPHGLDLSPA